MCKHLFRDACGFGRKDGHAPASLGLTADFSRCSSPPKPVPRETDHSSNRMRMQAQEKKKRVGLRCSSHSLAEFLVFLVHRDGHGR